MKKVVAFLCASMIVIAALFFINSNFQHKIDSRYTDKMGDIINYHKFQGLAMQAEAAKRGDTLFLYGSSEVGGSRSKDPYHPINFFSNKRRGFQVDLIGRAYCQSLIHTLNMGAMGSRLKGRKVVMIISPQWFDHRGLTLKHFNVNFSEEQFYAYMSNKNISMKLKEKVAERILKITSKGSEWMELKNYCKMIVKPNLLNKAKLLALKPYFDGRSALLQLRDKEQTTKIIDSANRMYFINDNIKNVPIDWKKDLEQFNKLPVNNPFAFDNTLFTNVYSKEIRLMKKYTHPIDLKKAPEFGDFDLLLETFKEVGIHPLIINLPMNGRWYDYCGIYSNERNQYYEKIKEVVKPYGFHLLDMSKEEYSPHSFKDSSHLEWKGLVFVDEAIDQYYHEKN